MLTSRAASSFSNVGNALSAFSPPHLSARCQSPNDASGVVVWCVPFVRGWGGPGYIDLQWQLFVISFGGVPLPKFCCTEGFAVVFMKSMQQSANKVRAKFF